MTSFHQGQLSVETQDVEENLGPHLAGVPEGSSAQRGPRTRGHPPSQLTDENTKAQGHRLSEGQSKTEPQSLAACLQG